MGLVISGVGLSALMFTTIPSIAFPGDTSSLLGLLAFGSSLPMVFGFFFIRPIPLPPDLNGNVDVLERDERQLDNETGERQRLLDDEQHSSIAL